MAFYLMTPYFLWQRRTLWAGGWFLAGGTAAGLVVGLARMAQGGHFPSDVMWAGVLVYATGAVAWRMTRPDLAGDADGGRVGAGAGGSGEAESRPGGAKFAADREVELANHAATGAPMLSVVVPFFNEEETVEEVLKELRACQPEAEIVAVDDGSRDGTWAKLRAMPGIRAVRLARNMGQSAAIYHGLRLARGKLCALMDGDGQNDPASLQTLVEAWKAGQADVICGYRANRRDTWSRRVASRWANGIRNWFLHDGIRDTGCSLKLFPREAVEELVPFNGLHRFLPAFFRRAGYSLAEAPVNHRPRLAGQSKYTNVGRAIRGAWDLIGVQWLLSRKIHTKAAEARSGDA